MDDNKRFEHDCDRCTFLGQHGEYDLYACPSSAGEWNTSFIARMSDRPEGYKSFNRHSAEELQKAGVVHPTIEAMTRYDQEVSR